MIAFARRNAREILRDPLSLGFGLGFPMILLALMTLIQRNVPVEIFEMSRCCRASAPSANPSSRCSRRS